MVTPKKKFSTSTYHNFLGRKSKNISIFQPPKKTGNEEILFRKSYFSGMPRQIELFFQHNQLISHRVGTKNRQSKSKFIQFFFCSRIFSYNHVTKLDAYTFQSMQQLEKLNLSHNRLVTIDNDAFQGLDALTVL